ncbi:preprotein translocase subunit YajC [Oenococcus oeni]|uniref:Preprotein translocase subunit YajC n=1 Tax=Oenococcus oeni TaxID=1247 RepID=A0A6N4A186_OENOE|nr:preprotein translocase subunit YajC [Oenococcus oeni]KGH82113.1 preprotein translocase subunit YajC [Oenococcus oeni S14]KGI01623.1 preprotein translocase subunit YajC [Oenococcus oeni IOEB_C52]KMQ39151.1 preprotein translocase subunit YajC [Oenococcus oeni]OIK56657.1 preprotein translocase subunit YajC [Oenococcus oeni]OIK86209.1 preprotein translocase subunit YajC [Oenococcus oeni]
MFNNLFIAAAKTGLSSWIPTILIYVVLIGGLFWWSSRRRKQANEQQQKMRTGLVKGAQVVTIGGLHGVVDSIDTEKKIVTLDVEGVYLPFEQRAIARIIAPTDGDQETKITKNEDKKENK